MNRTKWVRRARDLRVWGTVAVAGVLLTGCRQGLSEEEFAALRGWLTCDECLQGERDTVAVIGPRVVPFLLGAFDSLPGGRRENLRQQYRTLYGMMESPTLAEATFVDTYIDAFDRTVRSRIALSLGDLEEWDALSDLRDQAAARGYGEHVIDVIDGQLLQEPGAFTEGSGTADAWAITEPTSTVELCDGQGPAVCTAELSTTWVAAAETPSGTGTPPWTRVVFFVRPAAPVPEGFEVVDVVDVFSVTDNGVVRTFNWSATLTAGEQPPGPIELIAVGIDASGDGFSTPVNTEVSVVQGR